MAKHYPPKPEPQPPRCLCGLTYLEVPIMWSLSGDRGKPSGFYCPACLPAEYLPIVAADVAKLSEGQ